MGDVSVICRRKKDGTVQFGWGGNWGSYRNVGQTLILWYDNKDMVDYLFTLGQLSNIDAPYSETNEQLSEFYRTCPTGSPHWESDTEEDIFSKIAFTDYAYFYEESDEGWYYIEPGPFCIKIPIELVDNNLDEHGQEYAFLNKIRQKVITYLLNDYPQTDPEFATLLAKYDMDNLRKTLDTDYPFYTLCRHYRKIYDYMDNWVVIVPDTKEEKISGVLMRKREEPRMETINWPGHPVHKKEEYVNPVITNHAFSYVAGWLEGLLEVINDPARTMPSFDIPKWFLKKFRAAVGDNDAVTQLLRRHYSDLYGNSQSFDSRLSRGLELGREFYEKYIEKCKNR